MMVCIVFGNILIFFVPELWDFVRQNVDNILTGSL